MDSSVSIGSTLKKNLQITYTLQREKWEKKERANKWAKGIESTAKLQRPTTTMAKRRKKKQNRFCKKKVVKPFPFTSFASFGQVCAREKRRASPNSPVPCIILMILSCILHRVRTFPSSLECCFSHSLPLCVPSYF